MPVSLPAPIDASATSEPLQSALSDLEDTRLQLARDGVDETYDRQPRRPLAYPDGHFTVLDIVNRISLPPDGPHGLTPFCVDGVPIGWLKSNVVDAMRADVAKMWASKLTPCFDITEQRVTFSDNCNDFDTRTEHMDRLVRNWKHHGRFQSELSGWRDEKYAIWTRKSSETPLPGSNVAFFLERAACSLFGFATFGVHMTGYTVHEGEYSLWVARRSQSKATWPGLLDNTVAGGITMRATPLETIVRECGEEASLEPNFVLSRLRSAGIISYTSKTRDGEWWQPETQYVYDLQFETGPHAVEPATNDDEVHGFEKMSEQQAIRSVLDGEWKPNCALVLIDFLIRHGRITPESDSNYAEVCVALRRGIGGLPMPA